MRDPKVDETKREDRHVSNCHGAKTRNKYERIPHPIMCGFVAMTTYTTEWYDECSECGQKCNLTWNGKKAIPEHLRNKNQLYWDKDDKKVKFDKEKGGGDKK